MGYAPDDGVNRPHSDAQSNTDGPAFGWRPTERETSNRRPALATDPDHPANLRSQPRNDKRSEPYWVPSRPGELPPTIIHRRKSASEPVFAGRRISHPVVVAMAVAAVGTGSFYSNNSAAGAVEPTTSIDRSNYQRFASLGDHLGSNSTLIATPASTGDTDQDEVSAIPERGSFTEYTVQAGDELKNVAAAFGLRTSTLIYANNLSNPDLIFPGDVLTIPPTDGVTATVQDGDTLADIATRYGVSVTAIINYEANGITDPDLIYTGQSLVIPGGTPPAGSQQDSSGASAQFQAEASPTPVPEPEPVEPEGVTYEVQQGDSLLAIASAHGVEVSAIVNWGPNGISNPDALQPGQSLFIPGGTTPSNEGGSAQFQEAAQAEEVEQEPEPTPAPDPTPTPAPDPTPTPEPEPEPSNDAGAANGNFIWPTEGVITQRFGNTSFSQSSGWYGSSGHTGLDIANSTNTPIHAADGGTVIVSGWSGGYGYAVAIDHGNGYVTWYAHMAQQPPVGVGQRVSQGDYIGPMGSTGYSTGPHLHFEIRKNGGYQDPLQYLR